MGTSDPSNETFLALIEDAFRRLLEEPEAREHVAGFASGRLALRGHPGRRRTTTVPPTVS